MEQVIKAYEKTENSFRTATSTPFNRFVKKHPMSLLWINYIVAALLVIFGISLIASGLRTNRLYEENLRISNEFENYKIAQLTAEQDREASATAALNSERAKREADTILLAKALAGIDSFVENYGYSENDLRTYCECIINRVVNDNGEFSTLYSIEDSVMKEGQWVGFSESNQVIDKYYRIAQVAVNAFYNGSPRPCSAKYCWAELRKDGIWLKDQFSDSKYVNTWRYQG